MQVEVIDKWSVNLGPSILQWSEPVRWHRHFAGLGTKRLRDIGDGSKDWAAFGIDFHSRVGRNRWIERWAGLEVKMLALEAVLD